MFRNLEEFGSLNRRVWWGWGLKCKDASPRSHQFGRKINGFEFWVRILISHHPLLKHEELQVASLAFMDSGWSEQFISSSDPGTAESEMVTKQSSPKNHSFWRTGTGTFLTDKSENCPLEPPWVEACTCTCSRCVVGVKQLTEAGSFWEEALSKRLQMKIPSSKYIFVKSEGFQAQVPAKTSAWCFYIPTKSETFGSRFQNSKLLEIQIQEEDVRDWSLHFSTIYEPHTIYMSLQHTRMKNKWTTRGPRKNSFGSQKAFSVWGVFYNALGTKKEKISSWS